MPHPLHCSPEGQNLDDCLTNANMTLRQVMNTAVTSLDPQLISLVIDFVRAQGRPPQSEGNSDHSVNVHFHFHL